MPPVAEETTEIGAATESKDTTEIKETNTERVTEPFREVDGAFDETDGDPITGGTICIIGDTVACKDFHCRGLHWGSPSTGWLMWDSSKSPSFSFLTVGNNFSFSGESSQGERSLVFLNKEEETNSLNVYCNEEYTRTRIRTSYEISM